MNQQNKRFSEDLKEAMEESGGHHPFFHFHFHFLYGPSRPAACGGGGGGGGIAAAWSAAFTTAPTDVTDGGLPPRSLCFELLPILLALEGFPAL